MDKKILTAQPDLEVADLKSLVKLILDVTR